MTTHTVFRRWYQDSTWVTAMTSHGERFTPETTARMVRCGVNLIGFDQLQPFDGRLAAMVWSWAKDQPAATGDCTYQGSDTRFYAATCDQSRHYACLDGAGDYRVTAASGGWGDGRAACATEFGTDARFAVPPNGLRNTQLAAATGGADVWLDYAQVDGSWTPWA